MRSGTTTARNHMLVAEYWKWLAVEWRERRLYVDFMTRGYLRTTLDMHMGREE